MVHVDVFLSSWPLYICAFSLKSDGRKDHFSPSLVISYASHWPDIDRTQRLLLYVGSVASNRFIHTTAFVSGHARHAENLSGSRQYEAGIGKQSGTVATVQKRLTPVTRPKRTNWQH